jgi:hypothetical protein
MSWYFSDSSHGDGLTEGLDSVQRRVWLEIVLLGHPRLPRFRALHSRGNTPTSCLVSYSQHTVATRLPKLFGLEVEEEGSDLPSLRVQAPLYRRGPGYRLGVRLPGCRLPRGRGLDVGPPSSNSLSDTGNFIKCLSPWTGISEAYALRSASDPFVEEAPTHWLVEAERGWRHACLPPLSILSGPCRFWKSSHWRSFVVFTGLGFQRWSRQPAAGAAGPSIEAGLSGLTSWRFLGRQPADSPAFGLPG